MKDVKVGDKFIIASNHHETIDNWKTLFHGFEIGTPVTVIEVVTPNDLYNVVDAEGLEQYVKPMHLKEVNG